MYLLASVAVLLHFFSDVFLGTLFAVVLINVQLEAIITFQLTLIPSTGLPFGSLSWLIYASLLGTRIAIIFKNDLQDGGEIGNLKLTIW